MNLLEIEKKLLEAIKQKDINSVKEIFQKHPTVNPECVDEEKLTPLQHACFLGDLELAKLVLDHGASVNFTNRDDNYTPLMFAAIKGKAELVKLLMSRGANVKIENCVNRTAAQMAAFTSQPRIVAIINSWVPYDSVIEPYTQCRELEDKPRIPSPELGHLLHDYLVYPSLHPVKLIIFIKDNISLIEHSTKFVYVLDSISSKSIRSRLNDVQSLSLKCHYLSYLINHCQKVCQNKTMDVETSNINHFNADACKKSLAKEVRRLIKKVSSKEDRIGQTPQINSLIVNCLVSFPYLNYADYSPIESMLRSLGQNGLPMSHLSPYDVLNQAFDTPYKQMYHQDKVCIVCGESTEEKKCSRCKAAYYCGSGCQNADFFQHKNDCKPVQISTETDQNVNNPL